MQKRSWTFLTNHGHVLAYLAKYPHSTTRQIAIAVGITERSVQNVIKDLVEENYVIRNKTGRNNAYEVNSELPLRHPLEKEYPVKSLLDALGCQLNN